MPSILNLKFKGNKSFVAFSNLNDAESLTQTWKVCTKVASFLEQGQRLENLSWRLWHLQNLIVDTDNAKSRREFKKLSKCMGDKLDKEKGRSIEELPAPDFKRNHSTDMIKQRAAEKERNREANLIAGGTIKRMQFIFSVDQPTHLVQSAPVKKPDTKPLAELSKRARAAARLRLEDTIMADPDNCVKPTTSTCSATATTSQSQALYFPTLFNDSFTPSALLFASPTLTTTMTYGEGFCPSGSTDDQFRISRPTIEVPLDEILFNDDPITEDGWPFTAVTAGATTNDINSVDEIIRVQNTHDAHAIPHIISTSAAGQQQDAIMLPIPQQEAEHRIIRQSVASTPPLSSQPLPDVVALTEVPGSVASTSASSSGADADADEDEDEDEDEYEYEGADEDDEFASNRALSDDDDIERWSPAPPTVNRASIFKNVPPLSLSAKEALPETIAPSRLHSIYGTRSSTPNTTRPTLTLKTQGAMTTRSSGPGASLTSLNPAVLRGNNNGANGPGAKAECSNCGATHTPLWRRGLNDELNCNACGLYCKLHKRPRPKSMRSAATNANNNPNPNSTLDNRAPPTPRSETVEVVTTSRPRSLSTKSSVSETQTSRSSATAQCYNCHTTATPLWRKDDEGKTVCNACGLYYKLHGSARPISMKSDVIRKRSRNEARRSSQSGLDDMPTSPVLSHRASPARDTSPTLAPDSTTQMSYEYADDSCSEFRSTSTSSELAGALGSNGSSTNSDSSALFNPFSMAFPGPYHPDYLVQLYGLHSDPHSASSSSESQMDSDPSMSPRSTKRRRMSTDSATEPPSSAVSYGERSAHSKKGSLDFPFNGFTHSTTGPALRGPDNTFWHPPMMPQSQNEPETFWHPPLVPPNTTTSRSSGNNNNNSHNNKNASSSPSSSSASSGREPSPPISDSASSVSSGGSKPPSNSADDSQIDFLHAAMIQDDELFSAYLHPHDEKPCLSENGSGTAMYVDDTYY